MLKSLGFDEAALVELVRTLTPSPQIRYIKRSELARNRCGFMNVVAIGRRSQGSSFFVWGQGMSFVDPDVALRLRSSALDEVKDQQDQDSDPEDCPRKVPRLSLFFPLHRNNIRFTADRLDHKLYIELP
jgi:hypothetical protein